MFAGVYNEHLIKNVAGKDVHIMVQNVFMYLDSIICNLGVMWVKGSLICMTPTIYWNLGPLKSSALMSSIWAHSYQEFQILLTGLVNFVFTH